MQFNDYIKIIDNAIETNSTSDLVINDIDIFIDILDHYANKIQIKWPSHIIQLNEINIHILIHELKMHIANQYDTNDIIEYIDANIHNKHSITELNSAVELTKHSQIISILNHFSTKYKFNTPQNLSNKITISKLTEELKSLYHFHTRFEYIIIYAKMYENKQNKEMVIEGPYFGEQANSQKEIDSKAKELVEKQQGNALLIKIYKRDGRSDFDIMTNAKKHYDRIYKEMSNN